MNYPASLLAFGLPSGFEWIVILIVALLIFGPKLPSVMRGLGASVREFKKGTDEGDSKKVDAAVTPTPNSSVAGSLPPTPPKV
jgi:sec-independent protein translocase protein TatA